MTNGRFAGKVALVTGAGTGLGAAIARRIAAEGGHPVLLGRREGPLRAVADSCGGLAVPGDTTNADDLARAVAAANSHFGPVGILVANAAAESLGSAERIAPEDWHRILAVNLDGALFAARAVLPDMRRLGGGAIVLVSSVAALASAPANVAYSTAKAGMLGLARSIARDFGRENIRCNAICPGWIRTELTERILENVGPMMGIPPEQLGAQLAGKAPLGRMAEPEEIAAAVAFLASEDASFITGSTLVADGGAAAVDVGTLAFVE
ncbi:SDR family NAD(P)-dependent oxidoreductase [Sphingobium sp. Sx8-8]|uniref:SDR family NAD(P)-dependent oxidoreductase n=1 Tax=Sphingobium sp. Sx8-8 TaxID=2933617 RepID=UPI001F57D419|nr:SDR family NAD(P)-dependent oxidoreductase [Sphingobium sp. Sx8-8]